MTDPARYHSQDPVVRRVQEAFAHLEPDVGLDDIVQRAARYLRHTTRPAGDEPEAASPLGAGEHHHRRSAALRPVLTPNPASSKLDPAAGEPAAALAVDRYAAVTVGGIELTSADLIAAQRRDSEAITHIYQAYAPALLRFFVAAVGDRHAAEDLTGTALAAAIEALPGFRGEVTKLGGWLFRIARHDLYDYRRRVAEVRTEILDEDTPDPQDLAIERLERSRVMAALEQLSTDQREVLLLRLAAGLTRSEVAATLGKTTGAVKSLQYRGLASLARVLGLSTEHEQQADGPDPSERPDISPR